MDFLIDLAINLVFCFIVYKIFDNYGFKLALLLRLICIVVAWIFEGFFEDFAFILLIPMGIQLLELFLITIIEYFAYKKTESFWTWLILSILLELTASYVFANIIAKIAF